MYLKYKTISCLATLTTCLLVGHSSTAHATPPEGTRELHVEKIELAHPAENLGYLSKITFCPVDEHAYTGEHLGVDIVCETPDRTCNCGDITVTKKSPVISSTLLNGKTQQWSIGPWCPQKKGFYYAFHLPKHNQPITILDEDGYLTRGILETLQTNDSGNTIGTLQGIAAQKIVEPLKTFFDFQCQKHDPSNFDKRLDFNQRHSMYYQAVDEKENGKYQTVRINPANHNFILLLHNIVTMFTHGDQGSTYNAIKDEINSFCSVVHHGNLAPMKLEEGVPFAITLSDSIKKANKPSNATNNQKAKVALTLHHNGTTSLSVQTASQKPDDKKTQHWTLTSRLTSMTGREITTYDETPREGYSSLLMTLSTPRGEDLLTLGPVYYQYSGSSSCSNTNGYLDRGCSSALTCLSREAEKALQQNASGLQSVLESQE